MEKLRNFMENVEGKHIRLAAALVIGGILGMLASITVNCALVEISINPYFGVYFGLLFMLIGGVILYRVKGGQHRQPVILSVFGALVVLSGIICFMLDKDWLLSAKSSTKVPVYALLGVSVCFALLFSVVDVINYVVAICCQSARSRPLVETDKQVWVVVITAIVMGFLFGLVFGLMEIEGVGLSQLRVALLREQSICYPIGAVVGAVATAYNQYLRDKNKDYAFDPLADDDLDEEADF